MRGASVPCREVPEGMSNVCQGRNDSPLAARESPEGRAIDEHQK